MTAALPDDVRAEWVKKIPLRRGGQVNDIADVAVRAFLIVYCKLAFESGKSIIKAREAMMMLL